MTVARQQLGQRGEDLACEELARRNYVIVERRYRTRAGELDIVARDGECLVFVEVKARSGTGFGHAAEAVTPEKQQRIVWMATDYLARHQLTNVACRFDVVAINTDVTPPDVTVLADAFRPGW